MAQSEELKLDQPPERSRTPGDRDSVPDLDRLNPEEWDPSRGGYDSPLTRESPGGLFGDERGGQGSETHED